MINIVLIDDEPLARSIIREYLMPYPDVTILQECNDGFEGVKAIMHHKPDLIFLDIQMPKINGFEMLEILDEPPSVIFTTAFDEYAIKAFETNAIDYLLKPFSRERFEMAIQKYMHAAGTRPPESAVALLQTARKQQEEQHRVVVKNGADIRIVPVSEIYYIEAYDDYVKIFTADNYFLKKKTMNYFEEILSQNDFLRVHRSYIVQLQQITKIEPLEKGNHIALLKNGKKIPLSRSGYSALKDKLGV